MVSRWLLAFVFLCGLVSPATAEDLVPRVVSVVWDAAGGGPAPGFITEVLRADLAAAGTFLVADPGDEPDAMLTFSLAAGSLKVAFHDALDPAKDWVQTLQVTGTTSAVLRAAADTLTSRWSDDLAPVPPKVREVVTQKVVQDVVVHTTEKGVSVTLVGLPGTRVVLPSEAVVTWRRDAWCSPTRYKAPVSSSPRRFPDISPARFRWPSVPPIPPRT